MGKSLFFPWMKQVKKSTIQLFKSNIERNVFFKYLIRNKPKIWLPTHLLFHKNLEKSIFIKNYYKALNHPSKIYNIIIICARNLPTTLTHNAYHHHSASNGLISPYKWWVVRVPKIWLFQVFYIKSENAFEELTKILPSIFVYPNQSLIY